MNREQPIDVRLRRDQVRTIRGLVNAEMDRQNFRPAYLVGLLEILDNAETAGTIRNASLSALLDDIKSDREWMDLEGL